MKNLAVIFVVFIWTITFRQVITSAIEGLCQKYKCRRVANIKLDQPRLYRITRLNLLKVNIERKYLLKTLVIFNNAYILVLILLIPWSLMYSFNIGPQEILRKSLVIKFRVLDVPTFILLITFYRRRHKKATRHEWKF